MAVPALLAARRARGAPEPVEPAVAGIAWQEPGDRRLSRPAAAPRAGGEFARGAGALARRPQPGKRAIRSEPQHFFHAVEARPAGDQPARGAHRALGVD